MNTAHLTAKLGGRVSVFQMTQGVAKKMFTGSQLLASVFRFIVVMTIISSLAGLAFAQKPKPPIEIFYDDQLLSGAREEISNMSYSQASQFKAVLSECGEPFSENDMLQHSCSVAKSNYEIEFGSHSDLDRIVSSAGMIAMLIRSEESSHKKDPDSSKMFLRLEEIDDALRMALSARFATLRANISLAPR